MNTSKLPLFASEPAKLPMYFLDDTIFEGQLPNILLAMCSDVGSDLALNLERSLRSKDWDKVVEICDISPLDYGDAVSYLKDAQLTGLVKKYPFWNIQTNAKLEAMKTFIACERKCDSTNIRLLSERSFTGLSAVNTISYIAQKRISAILGDCPSPEELSFEFGPGSAYGVKYNTSALNKLGSTLDVTEACYETAQKFVQSCPGWTHNKDFLIEGPRPQQQLNVVIGDRLSFVPKTAKTDRPIAIGPLVNVLLQKGIGTVIRSRLKPYNDLNKLQDLHKIQAYKGSLTGEVCTIDLKSASDTIAYATVMNLLPHPWFELLESARSPSYEIEGQSYDYSKFSAMGNGYTFELESLIFYALAYATCIYYGHDISDVSVFGDDIIAPNAAFGDLKRTLTYYGFEINTRKSFNSGPFRESCGGDYFNGINVRPFYLKDKVTYRTLFLFHNFLVKSGWQFYFPKTYRYVRQLIGKPILKYYKTWNELDDGGLLDFSQVVGDYNTVKTSYKGLKSSALLKHSYGVALILYRKSLSDKQSLTDFDWRNQFTRRSRLKCRLYRYVHI